MRRLIPVHAGHGGGLGTEELLADASAPSGTGAFVRFNMVTSLDGVGVLDGASAGLGTPADRTLFPLLRAVADAIVVGSGTVRAEGYSGELLSDELRAWRIGQGMSERPRTVILSARASLSAQDPALLDVPERVLVVVSSGAEAARVQALETVADVLVLEDYSPAAITSALLASGLRHLHHEGGPRILRDYASAGAIDSLCLTLSPLLAPGRAGHGIDDPGEPGAPLSLELHRLYEEDGTLLADYRPRAAS